MYSESRISTCQEGKNVNVLTSCKVKQSIQQNLIDTFPDVEFQFCKDIEEAEAHLPQAEVLITYGEDLTEAHIEKASALKWIMVISAGLDRMPFEKIAEKGILITNAKGIHKTPMAEYAIGMLLQVSRQAKQLYENEKGHKWDRSVKMTEITGSTLMVVGAGAIGQEVARLGKAFQMKTIGVSRSARPTEYFDESITTDAMLARLNEADFVVSILPKTKDTEDFFRLQHFQAMKEKAVFLNMGRGDVVKEEDLIQALEQGEIGHAVLDVFKEEPLPAEHPLWDMPNVTITPHLSGISRHYQPRAFEIFKKNLEAYKAGNTNLINVIDPKRGY